MTEPHISRIRAWTRKLWHRAIHVDDTPDSIAAGMAVGTLLGFTPLFGIKTLIALLVAWVCRCNKIAAVVGVTLHDLILPFAPLVLIVEYQVGSWLLSSPHHFARSIKGNRLHLDALTNWHAFIKTGGPLLLGSVVIGLPLAIVAFFVTRAIVRGVRSAKLADEQATQANEQVNSSVLLETSAPPGKGGADRK